MQMMEFPYFENSIEIELTEKRGYCKSQKIIFTRLPVFIEGSWGDELMEVNGNE